MFRPLLEAERLPVDSRIDRLAAIGEPKLRFKEVDQLLACSNALLKAQSLGLGRGLATCPATDSAEFDKILGDALIFLTERFCHEEDLMRSFTAEPLLRPLIDRHKEDHAELSAELLSIVLNLQKHGLQELVPRFQRLLGPSLDNHRRNHDAVLDQWTAETKLQKSGVLPK